MLGAVVPWFWDESVGGVSGLPLPNEATPRWLYPLRIAEVYYGVAFLRVAQGAADAIMVMPGMIAGYRRAVVDELGGFAQGINGEDADITMRIGRLGYRIVTDLDVRVRTEVPETLAHLREQRQRWARGLFHMAGRNMSTIWMRQGLRGLWILPWSIFNASRRSMMIPILVCALAVELLDPTVFALREISVVAGFLVGLQLVVVSVLLIAYRQFAAMPFVPAYLLFRMFRAYTAFETLLTLRLKPSTTEAGAATTRAAAERRSAFDLTLRSRCARWSASPDAAPCSARSCHEQSRGLDASAWTVVELAPLGRAGGQVVVKADAQRATGAGRGEEAAHLGAVCVTCGAADRVHSDVGAVGLVPDAGDAVAGVLVGAPQRARAEGPVGHRHEHVERLGQRAYGKPGHDPG